VTERADADRLRRLLGGPDLREVLRAARERLEADGEGARSCSLPALGDAERRALAGLLGVEALPPDPIRLELGRLDAALRECAVSASLREVLEALGGPLRDRRGTRGAERSARAGTWAAARARIEAASDRREALLAWLEGLRRTGLVAKGARGEASAEAALLARAVEVALRLPADGVLLPVFAAAVAGDPHALDGGTPLAGLVLRAAAALTSATSVPTDAAGRRALWCEVGVECDGLSSDVLVLGLRPHAGGRLASQLRESAEDGEPRRITLRELSRARLEVAPGTPVFVCENPAVVEAAADALGERSAALVCLEGVRSTAAHALLRALAVCGAGVRVHADFDWAGLRIAGQALAATGGSPWRFGAADYRAAIAAGAGGPALTGSASPSPWAPGLAESMDAGRVAVAEEAVLGHLLMDLGS
jgi:uncharacterized protein (TIGR02679 family)